MNYSPVLGEKGTKGLLEQLENLGKVANVAGVMAGRRHSKGKARV